MDFGVVDAHEKGREFGPGVLLLFFNYVVVQILGIHHTLLDLLDFGVWLVLESDGFMLDWGWMLLG